MSSFPTQTCEIKRYQESYTDPETGQFVEGGYQLIATVEADIQPKSGRVRAAELQTEYESDYIAFVDFDDITFETGYTEIKKGDHLFELNGKEHNIVFPGRWSDHYELELKEQ